MTDQLSQLLRSVDQQGHLMPSFLWSETAAIADEIGLVETCLAGAVKWQRLTEAGKRAKAAFERHGKSSGST